MTDSINSFIHDPHYIFSNISQLFSSISEALASELLENLEEMFPCYHIHSDTSLGC